MLKTLLTYAIVFVSLFFLSCYFHQYLLKVETETLPFSLKEVYIFHAIFSCVICIILFLISKSDPLKDQIGFLYLGGFIFKLVAFASIFSGLFFQDLKLSLLDKLSLLIPLFIFLVPEVYFVIKILRNLNTSKK